MRAISHALLRLLSLETDYTTVAPLARATALVKELTLEEKLNNTGNTSPGVPRLGIPEYQWWNEGL